MAVYKVVKERNYTVVDNGFINDPNLSWKAKGIMLYFLSLPEDWKIHLDEIKNHATDGISSLKAGVKELTEQGYTKRQPVRDENGAFVEWETLIFERKHGENVENSPLDENPLVENPLVENPLVENRTLLNTNKTKYSYKPNTKSNNLRGDEDFKKKVISEWNSLDKNIPKIKTLNSSTDRYKMLKARINEHGLDKVLEAIRSIGNSQFLQGYRTSFVITFDWFIRPNNFVKVLEGNYTDKQSQEPKREQENRSSYQEGLDEQARREFYELKKEMGL